MAEVIIDGAGSGNSWRINSDGAGLVNVTGSIVIGSVSAHVESIYVQSGITFVDSRPPTQNTYNPGITLVWGAGATGSQLNQVIKSTPAGSAVMNLSWTGTLLTGVGSWI